MVKRDRWNSSSSEDEGKVTDKHAISKKKSNKKQQQQQQQQHIQDDDTTNNTNDNKKRTKNDDENDNTIDESSEQLILQQQQQEEQQQKKQLSLLHNPLLHGCRSVYDNYERISRINEGTYGIVWKARYIGGGCDDDSNKNDNNDNIVALKQIKFNVFDTNNNETDEQSTMYRALSNNTNGYNTKSEGFPINVLREISVLLALSHESIVNVKEMVVGDTFDKVFMVMELFEFDLKVGLEQFPNSLSQSELKSILLQILNGVHHMHTLWYIHRDLKPSNILIHKSGRVAIGDFGLARSYENPPSCYNNMTLLVVTLWYRCPELLFGIQQYGSEIDMWSIGCIFGELIRKEPLFTGQGEIDQIQQIFTTIGIPTTESWPTFTLLPNTKLFRWSNNNNNNNNNTKLLPKLFPIASVISGSSKQAFLDTNGYNLLQQLLCLDPNQRISANDAIQHKYFSHGVQPKIPQFFSSSGT